MTETIPRPRRQDVAGLYIILDVEVVTTTNDTATDRLRQSRDLDTVKDIITRITKHTNEEPYSYYSDEIEDSEYDSDMKVYAGKWAGEVTVEEWLKIADEYCLDLEEDEVLPDNIEQTMGSLTEYGLLPAVSIPYIDEGWGYGGYEPSVIVSMYVSVAIERRGRRIIQCIIT